LDVQDKSWTPEPNIFLQSYSCHYLVGWNYCRHDFWLFSQAARLPIIYKDDIGETYLYFARVKIKLLKIFDKIYDFVH